MEFIFIGECAAFFGTELVPQLIVLSLVLTYSPISVSRSNLRSCRMRIWKNHWLRLHGRTMYGFIIIQFRRFEVELSFATGDVSSHCVPS
jgi:hypothetical protein